MKTMSDILGDLGSICPEPYTHVAGLEMHAYHL